MKTKPIEKIKYKDFKIKVYQDTSCGSPDNWGNEDLFLVYDHPRYFGVKRDGFKPLDILNYLQAKDNYQIACNCLKNAKNTLKQAKNDFIINLYEIKNAKIGLLESREAKKEAFEYLRDEVYHYDEYEIFTVFAYCHSGVKLSLNNCTYPFNDRWDVSSSGFILLNKSDFNLNEHKKSYSELKDKTDHDLYCDFAQGLIDEWNDYLSGNVYGFQITYKGNDIDSCWGYYGNYKTNSYMIDECKNIIDNEVKRMEIAETKRIEKLYGTQLKFAFA